MLFLFIYLLSWYGMRMTAGAYEHRSAGITWTTCVMGNNNNHNNHNNHSHNHNYANNNKVLLLHALHARR